MAASPAQEPPDTGQLALAGSPLGGIGSERAPATSQLRVPDVSNADTALQDDGSRCDDSGRVDCSAASAMHDQHQRGSSAGHRGPRPLGGGTWLQRVRAEPTPAGVPSKEAAMASRMMQGVWKTDEMKMLLTTLTTDWAAYIDREWPSEVQAMRDLAHAPANACCDESIRAWSEAGEGTLLAYTSGMLELPHPPNFIKEIRVSEHRALLKDFHEAHMNYTLKANLPPYVNLPRNAPHVAILEELHKANVDPATGIGLPVLRGLLNDVKRFIYDGSHTLSFVFYSKRAAQSWVKKALRFQRAVISLHDTVRRPQDEGTGSFSPAQLELQYALYVHGAGALDLAALARAMSQFAGAKVLDVEYPRSQKTDIYDNRFHKVIFAQAQCPDALMGVTRVDLNGTMITVHHFQANLRFPCTRCFNARHSAKMCKVPGRLLAKTQARFSRVYKGEVTKVTLAGDSAYRVNSVTELLALFTAQQDELAQNGSALLERTEVVTTANDTSTIAPSASSPALTTPADVRLDAASSLTARDDGFAVKRSKKDQRAVKKTEQTSHSTQSAAKNAKTSKSSTKQKPSAKAKSRTKQATGFAAFQRAEALGQYGPLADDDSVEDDSVDDDIDISDSEVHHHDDDEAPYAYADSTGERHATDMEVDTNFPGVSPEHAVVATAHEERQRDDDQERVVVRKKARRDVPTVAAAANPDAASTELVQRSMADYVHTSQAIIDSEAEIVTAASTEILPPSPASDEEFTMGAPHAGTEVGDSDLPIPLPLWLKDFQGNPVDVAANGQCAILALHATTTNYDGQLLPKTSKVTRGANKLKRFVYTIMFSNLRKDVELGLVDPVSEIRRLYPNRQHGDGIASATASLFNHYIEERDRSVSGTVPSSFWAGTHELRAMAQYMREPLFVLDVDEHGDAHVQIYMYKTYRTSSGSDHESGYGKVLNDRAAKAYLEECRMLHTVPTFLILYHDKHHFNGVQHGELLLQWTAEGDQDYADSLDTSYEWLIQLNKPLPGDGDALEELDVLSRNANVNAMLLRNMNMRDRLDIVLARLGFPTLSTAELDERELEATMTTDEMIIHEAYGVDGYASGSQSSSAKVEGATQLPSRSPRIASGKVVEDVYIRLLRAISTDAIREEDRPQCELMQAANQEAFSRWVSLYRESLGIPMMKRTETKVDFLHPWLLNNCNVLRHLFAFLPYPELEAKTWSIQDLVSWGSAEVYFEQTTAIARILHDENTSPAVRVFCSDWHSRCVSSDNVASMHRHAEAPEEWRRHKQWLPAELCRDNYVELPDDEWKLLHVLPYVLTMWGATSMGRTPHCARLVWHHEYPFLDTLCKSVISSADWGMALHAPSGLTWVECDAVGLQRMDCSQAH